MRYVAFEEAFSIPELDGPQPPPWPENRFSQRSLADWARRLPDFTEFRLPRWTRRHRRQVLSLTVPSLQGRQDAPAARTHARRANDYLAQVIAEHPDRFRTLRRRRALPARIARFGARNALIARGAHACRSTTRSTAVADKAMTLSNRVG